MRSNYVLLFIALSVSIRMIGQSGYEFVCNPAMPSTNVSLADLQQMEKCQTCNDIVFGNAKKIETLVSKSKSIDGEGVSNTYVVWGDTNRTVLFSGIAPSTVRIRRIKSDKDQEIIEYHAKRYDNTDFRAIIYQDSDKIKAFEISSLGIVRNYRHPFLLVGSTLLKLNSPASLSFYAWESDSPGPKVLKIFKRSAKEYVLTDQGLFIIEKANTLKKIIIPPIENKKKLIPIQWDEAIFAEVQNGSDTLSDSLAVVFNVWEPKWYKRNRKEYQYYYSLIDLSIFRVTKTGKFKKSREHAYSEVVEESNAPVVFVVPNGVQRTYQLIADTVVLIGKE